MFFFVYRYGDHLDLHVLTHSFPTRRSSDLEQQQHHFADLEETPPAEVAAAGLQGCITEHCEDETEYTADDEAGEVHTRLLVPDAVEEHPCLAAFPAHGEHDQQLQAAAAALAELFRSADLKAGLQRAAMLMPPAAPLQDQHAGYNTHTAPDPA